MMVTVQFVERGANERGANERSANGFHPKQVRRCTRSTGDLRQELQKSHEHIPQITDAPTQISQEEG